MRPRAVVALDLDGDLDLDLAVPDYESTQLALAINSGTGTFTPGASPTLNTRQTCGVAADMDADGDQTFAWAPNPAWPT